MTRTVAVAATIFAALAGWAWWEAHRPVRWESGWLR